MAGKLDKGLIHVYTGNSKGKTTAALGLSLRALGQGFKVCFIQVLKGQDYGEWNIREALFNFDMYRFGRKTFIHEYNSVDAQLVEEALKLFEKAITSGEYDLVVLDEINVACYFKLVEPKKIVDIIKKKRKDVEIVLTGRYAPEEFLEIADYVTEMKEIKHPYMKNIDARRGIEY